MIKEKLFRVREFYKECDKFTLLICILILHQILGFSLNLPATVVYVAVICYMAFQLQYGNERINYALIPFVVYAALGLIVMSPDSVFRSWERYTFFLVLLICFSSICAGKKAVVNRQNMFKIALVICAVVGVGSFFCSLIGINGMKLRQDDIVTGVGLFGGLTKHSMLLGPIAGIGAVYLLYLACLSKSRVYLVLSILSLMSVFLSASRSSAISTIVAVMIVMCRMLKQIRFRWHNIVLAVVLLIFSFSLFGSSLNAVMLKNENNIEKGSIFYSREDLWRLRIEEFKDSPLFGCGLYAIDNQTSGFNVQTGMVETGSSWLMIFSMTGIIGAVLLLPHFLSTYIFLWRNNEETYILLCALLTLFFMHMIAEGYIFYAGSQMAFLFWLTMGIAMDRKFIVKQRQIANLPCHNC